MAHTGVELAADPTSGLRDRLDHPELVVLNVPAGAVGWAAATLNAMASDLDESGASFRPGEVYAAAGASVDEWFTFDRLTADGSASIGFPTDREFLVVIPLP